MSDPTAAERSASDIIKLVQREYNKDSNAQNSSLVRGSVQAMCTDTRLESYNPAAFEHILLSPEEYHNKDRYRCYPIQPFARSAAAAELSNDNLKTTESIYKTLFFIMEYYFRTPSFYTLLEEQNNPHYKAGFWDFIWDRLREMRKTFTSQTINANALYEMEMHPQHGITYRNKDLSAGDKPPNNFIISLDTFQRERRQGIHILEFTVAILLVGCASFATSAKDELRDFVIGKKSLFLESLSQCFTELISYYRLNRKKRVDNESEREEDYYYYYSKKNSEFISLMLLQSGLELNKKVEDRSSFLPTHGIDVLKSTGETETVTVAEEPHDSVSFASVYTEIHNHAKLFDNQNHKRNNPFIQNVLDVMDCINARNYYQFFYLLGGRDVTPDHQNGTNMEQFVQINPTQNRKFTFLQKCLLMQYITYGRVRAVLELMTPNYYTFAKLRWRGGISVLLLANFLLFASVEDCEAFLRRLGLEPFLIPSKEGGLLLRITDADKSDCLITLKAMLDYVDSEAWAGEKYEKNKITLCYPVRSDFLHLRVWREQIQKNTLVEKDLKQQIMQHVKQQSIQIPISDYYKSDWIKQNLSSIQHESEIQLDIFSDEFLFLNCANCPVDYLFYVESVVPFYQPTQQTNTLTDCPETLFERLDEHKREGMLKVILASLHNKNNNVKNIVLEHTNEVLDYLETETTKSSLSTTSSQNNNENGIGDEYHLDNSKGSIYHYLRKYIRSHHGGENTEIENHNNNNTILHLHSVTSDATINNNNDNEEVESDNSEARKTTEINFFLDDIMSNSLYKKIETELETKQRENEEKEKQQSTISNNNNNNNNNNNTIEEESVHDSVEEECEEVSAEEEEDIETENSNEEDNHHRAVEPLTLEAVPPAIEVEEVHDDHHSNNNNNHHKKMATPVVESPTLPFFNSEKEKNKNYPDFWNLSQNNGEKDTSEVVEPIAYKKVNFNDLNKVKENKTEETIPNSEKNKTEAPKKLNLFQSNNNNNQTNNPFLVSPVVARPPSIDREEEDEGETNNNNNNINKNKNDESISSVSDEEEEEPTSTRKRSSDHNTNNNVEEIVKRKKLENPFRLKNKNVYFQSLSTNGKTIQNFNNNNIRNNFFEKEIVPLFSNYLLDHFLTFQNPNTNNNNPKRINRYKNAIISGILSSNVSEQNINELLNRNHNNNNNLFLEIKLYCLSFSPQNVITPIPYTNPQNNIQHIVMKKLTQFSSHFLFVSTSAAQTPVEDHLHYNYNNNNYQNNNLEEESVFRWLFRFNPIERFVAKKLAKHTNNNNNNYTNPNNNNNKDGVCWLSLDDPNDEQDNYTTLYPRAAQLGKHQFNYNIHPHHSLYFSSQLVLYAVSAQHYDKLGAISREVRKLREEVISEHHNNVENINDNLSVSNPHYSLLLVLEVHQNNNNNNNNMPFVFNTAQYALLQGIAADMAYHNGQLLQHKNNTNNIKFIYSVTIFLFIDQKIASSVQKKNYSLICQTVEQLFWGAYQQEIKQYTWNKAELGYLQWLTPIVVLEPIFTNHENNNNYHKNYFQNGMYSIEKCAENNRLLEETLKSAFQTLTEAYSDKMKEILNS